MNMEEEEEEVAGEITGAAFKKIYLRTSFPVPVCAGCS